MTTILGILCLVLGSLVLWQESLLRKRDEQLRILREERDRDIRVIYERIAELRRLTRKQ